MNRSTRRAALGAALIGALALAGCERDAPETDEPVGAGAPSESADPHGPDEAEGALGPDEEVEERPIEELTEAELEAECYRGRRAACDLLGH